MSQILTLNVNKDNDLFVLGGDFSLARGKEAYAILISAALKTIKGEIKSDPSIGIPYFETIFDSRTKIPTWKLSVISRIKKFPFVKEINDFEISYDSRTSTLFYYMTITTDEGQLVVSNNNQ